VEAGAAAGSISISQRLEQAIVELRGLHEILLSEECLDARILTDFRDALNRVRNAAWSAQQYVATKVTGQDSENVLSIVAGERVRAAYQLCQTLQSDLKRQDTQFQKGQLIQLYSALKELTEQLSEVVGKHE
jgi:hypothetical protein